MRILERKLNADRKTGRITVDELPADASTGDVVVEVFPDLAFIEPMPFGPKAAITALEQLVDELTFPGKE